MKILVAVVAVAFSLASAGAAMASEQGGHGPRGGHHGGHGGHGGGHGGKGGGGSVSGGVSAPASAGGSASYSGTWGSTPLGKGTSKDRETMHADARACDPMGDIEVRSKQDGSFTYGGLEFHLPTFAQCMLDKGYKVSTAGRNALTDFGSAGRKFDPNAAPVPVLADKQVYNPATGKPYTYVGTASGFDPNAAPVPSFPDK